MPEPAPKKPKTVLRITRIIIKPCKNLTWQFEGKHEAGTVNYYGYPTVQEAAKAAAIWAITAETPVTIEFPTPGAVPGVPGIPASHRTEPQLPIGRRVRHLRLSIEFNIETRKWSDQAHAWYYYGRTTSGMRCSAREDLLEACETAEELETSEKDGSRGNSPTEG